MQTEKTQTHTHANCVVVTCKCVLLNTLVWGFFSLSIFSIYRLDIIYHISSRLCVKFGVWLFDEKLVKMSVDEKLKRIYHISRKGKNIKQ